MRIALVTDAWGPQVNGVVRTLTATVAELRRRGHEILTITPDLFRTVACPSYPEIRLAIGSGRAVARQLAGFAPDAVHIATEGPLGWAARRWCLAWGRAFTTSFHTRFPDYLAVRTGLSPALFWPMVRRFHAPARRVMAATQALADELGVQGLHRTHRWSRGVDLDLFRPDAGPLDRMAALPRPIQLCVGRVAVEKNIAAFLETDAAGTKVMVGDGPARAELEKRYPGVLFLGALHGRALAAAYATADVLVFPSRTDTFGLVMIEALATGTPVAAYPVRGPRDVFDAIARRSGSDPVGALNEELGTAIGVALLASRATCAAAAAQVFSWSAATDEFFAGLCAQQPMRYAA